MTMAITLLHVGSLPSTLFLFYSKLMVTDLIFGNSTLAKCRKWWHTVPDTPKFPFNARIRLYWPLVRSHSICSHSLSGECELMRYIWPKANARIRCHSCAHSHLGISHSHNSMNYPIQMRALASRCYAHSHYLALLKQSIFQSKCECASSQSIVSTHDCKPWGPLWSVCYQ